MLRLLLIDDNPDDRVLIRRELTREFAKLQVEEILEAEGLNQALEIRDFDLVITDYQLRWNDGITVLRELKTRYPDCPVIMFTDSGNQEVAVEAMKAGLDDYLIKSAKHFVRLPIAIRQALQRSESQRRVERLEVRLQTLLNRLNVGVFRSSLDGNLLEGNASFLRLLGVSSLEEAQTLHLQKLFLQPDAELQDLNQEYEVQLRRVDGSSSWILVNQTLNTTETELIIEGLIEDITERKLAQEALKQARDELEIRVTERTQELQQTNEQLLTEIQQHKQTQLSLRESEERYRQLVELSPDAIFIQCDGQFAFANCATAKLHGAKNPEELIGRAVMDFVHPDDREIVEQRMQKLRTGGTQAEWGELKVVRLDGRVIDIEAVAAPFTYQEKPAAQVVVRDITDRKTAEAELREALKKEQELSELKSRIITTISHEYRTPLTTILASAQLLEFYSDKFSQEKKSTHLQRIQTSTQHLTNLVNDALFIGQAEADKLKCNPVSIDLEQLCRDVIEGISCVAYNKKKVSKAIPKEFIAFSTQGNCTNACLDEKLLRQILTNLLSNAIKYSPEGGTVQFNLECVNGVARFRIQDQGIGIPQNDLPQLFESFHRATNVGTIPGTGLGLAIVKKCVDVHGGDITVESTEGVGTTFTVTLPLNNTVTS
jgi:PAS domain S-box-containing protein